MDGFILAICSFIVGIYLAHLWDKSWRIRQNISVFFEVLYIRIAHFLLNRGQSLRKELSRQEARRKEWEKTQTK